MCVAYCCQVCGIFLLFVWHDVAFVFRVSKKNIQLCEVVNATLFIIMKNTNFLRENVKFDSKRVQTTLVIRGKSLADVK